MLTSLADWWNGIDSSGKAAWVQAWVSLIALIIALCIPALQRRAEKRDREAEQRKIEKKEAHESGWNAGMKFAESFLHAHDLFADFSFLAKNVETCRKRFDKGLERANGLNGDDLYRHTKSLVQDCALPSFKSLRLSTLEILRLHSDRGGHLVNLAADLLEHYERDCLQFERRTFSDQPDNQEVYQSLASLRSQLDGVHVAALSAAEALENSYKIKTAPIADFIRDESASVRKRYSPSSGTHDGKETVPSA